MCIKKGIYKKCFYCFNKFYLYPYQKDKKYCSTNCANKSNAKLQSIKRKGKGNPMFGKRPWNYKGRTLTTDKYYAIVMNGERYREHRVIMERYLGRKLEKNEDIHHIDGNKLNNSIINLTVMKHGDHRRFHNKIRKET